MDEVATAAAMSFERMTMGFPLTGGWVDLQIKRA
jgi:hypothetical protein